jgi:hypothetical protein
VPDDRNICKVCLQPTSRIFHVPYQGAPEEEWELVSYTHDRESDVGHEVVPIKAEEAPFIDQVCDICGEPDLAWIFLVDSNKRRKFRDLEFTEEAWATCQACHDDILVSPTGLALARRIAPRSRPLMTVPEHLHGHFVNEVFADLYQQFLDSREGDPIDFQEYVS